MADFSGIMGLFNKQPPDIPPWVEMTGPVGGQAMTTLTNPITGETFTAGSTNYRVRNDLYQPPALGGGLADGANQQPMDSGPRINELSYNDRQRELMKAAAGIDGSGYGGPGYRGPDPAMGGIGAALNAVRRPDGGHMSECPPGARCMNKGLEGINIPQGMNPMQAMGGMGPAPNNMIQEGFQGLGDQIDNLGDSMNSGFQTLLQKQQQQSPMQQQQTQLGMYGMPSFTAPNPYASSAFGNSLFGGIAPFLMNRYY